MEKDAGRHWVLLDLAAGFLAIVAVVGVSIRATFVGSDLRALFAVTAVAFYLAGAVRGRGDRLNVWLRGLLVSSPGLLGTGALIMNDGTHRLPIPVAVSLTAILFTVAGVQTRRWWPRSRGRGLALTAAGLCLLALEVAAIRNLVVFASLHRVDRAVPAFSLTPSAGEPVRSEDLRGKVVVLAFWASWCLPCRWEMPELESAFAAVRHDSTVTFLLVDAGWGGETPERGRRFIESRHVTVPTAFDAGSAAAALRVRALPTVVIMDRAGRVRFEHYGFDRSEHVGAVILQGIHALQRERPS